MSEDPGAGPGGPARATLRVTDVAALLILLYAEMLGLILVTVLSVVIFVRLGTGAVPPGHTDGGRVFALPPGTGIGTVAAASVFGFLAFAGFEGAAALGEETSEPRRRIPRALVVALAVVGTFSLVTIVAQVLGHGTAPDGVRAFQGADSPYGDLAGAWVGPVMADVLDVVAAIGLVAILLGVRAAAARVLYALARDGGGSGPVAALARLSRAGEPVVALLVAALAFVGYTIDDNVVGQQPPAAWFPVVVAGWILVATAPVGLVPGLAARVARNLRATLAEPSDVADRSSP